jgi:Sulfotransferase family
MENNSFVGQEHPRRLVDYRTEAPVFDLLRTMNEALTSVERYEQSGTKRPNLFIFGLPRSGTTLLYQLTACCFDIGYINNIAARFWRAPVIGVAFAQSLLHGRRDNSFVSDYGKSIELSGPHEFSYFWQRWLKITDIESACQFSAADDHIDWAGLADVLGCLQDHFGAGIVHKTNFVANFIRGFSANLPMPIFICIDRPCIDVAFSILKARVRYYGDHNAWWATYPPSYGKIKDLPFAQQIARQVVDLRNVYEQCMALVDRDLVLRFSYSELCDNPGAVLADIQRRVADRHGVEIPILEGVPTHFKQQRQAFSGSLEEEAVLAALKALGVQS